MSLQIHMYDADWFHTLNIKKVYNVGFHKDHIDVMTSRDNHIHSKLRSITPLAIVVHMILKSFVGLAWMRDTME